MKDSPEGILTVFTFGDSLTEGNARKSILRTKGIATIPNIYQTYIVKLLAEKDIDAEVINEGIGGQVFGEIWNRIEIAAKEGAFGPNETILSVVAGTNDVWRYSDVDEEIEFDLWEDMKERYDRVIPQLFEKFPKLKILLCTIPPIGRTRFVPKRVQHVIHFLNERLENYVKEHSEKWPLYFCNVHEAMQIEDGSMNPKLAIEDGVHFTPEGNKVCGETIGKCILKILGK